MREVVRKFIEEREWGGYHNPKDIAISIGIEAGELNEVFQWKGEEEVAAMAKDGEEVEHISSELCDILFYCLSLANCLEIDISAAFLRKMEVNAERYPVEKVKGDYRKYTEL